MATKTKKKGGKGKKAMKPSGRHDRSKKPTKAAKKGSKKKGSKKEEE